MDIYHKTVENFINYFLPDNKNGIYLVGGSIRDQLMGITPSDFDIVSKRNISRVASEISKKNNGKILHIGRKDYKVFRVVLSSQEQVDIAPMRGENIEEDVLKRDFTINAIAYDLSKKKLIDPSNGLKDLKRKQIKTVTKSVFKQDPIRLVRAYRIALDLGFTISKPTLLKIMKNRTYITKTKGERIWTELLKIFAHPNSNSTIADMGTSGLIFSIFPELLQFDLSIKEHRNMYLPIYIIRALNYIESILTITNSNNQPVLYKLCKESIKPKEYPLLKYTLLLHYIQLKRPILTVHEKYLDPITAKRNLRRKIKIVSRINKRLKLSSKQQVFVKCVLHGNANLQLMFETYMKEQLTNMRIVSFFEEHGSTTVASILHSVAKTRGKTSKPTRSDLHRIAFFHSLIELYTGSYCNATKEKPLLTGDDLIEILNIKPSPKFKQILTLLRRGKICGKISNKKAALKIAKQYLKGKNQSYLLTSSSDLCSSSASTCKNVSFLSKFLK